MQAQVEVTYNTVIRDGHKYLQINTYGSPERKAKGVVSHIIQFNEESAKQLIDIFEKKSIV